MRSANNTHDYFGYLELDGQYKNEPLQYIPIDYLKGLLTRKDLCLKLRTKINDRIKADEPIRISNYIPPKPIQKPKATEPKPTKKVSNKSERNHVANNDLAWAKSECLRIMADNNYMNLLELGWNFKLDNARRRAGQCSISYIGKFISLSRILTKLHTKDEVMNTITHEIAHAIDFEQRGTSDHSFIWAKIHKDLGGDGERCFTESKENKYKIYNYIAECENCGSIGGWIRKPKAVKRRCKKCKGDIQVVSK